MTYLRKFLFEPASALPLAVLRAGIAATLILQAISLAPDFFDFYGPLAYLQEGMGMYPSTGGIDYRHWLSAGLRLGIPGDVSLIALGLMYVLFLFGLLLGFKTRLSSVGTFLCHTLLTNGQITSYGLDQFAQQTLFFMMWMPCGAILSLDAFRGGLAATRNSAHGSPEARLSLRVLQLYLCIAYFFGGIEKAVGYQWWTGEAIWRSLMLPTFYHFEMSWLSSVPWVAKLAGWSTLMIEVGYPILIWSRATRKVWLLLTISMHLGIGVLMGLWLFALIMIVLNVSLFAVSASPTAAISAASHVRCETPAHRVPFESACG